ncbi:MAG: hypothetical protein OXF61_00190 [Acidimicrobiaceae bacterium]|nr:hypothetical protein [Acidimicrobiaceae bacterium]MCY3947598.1 hypothetical protein [Acidimicrobiaceae bacterium]
MATSTQPETHEKIIEVYVHTEGSAELQLLPVSSDGQVRDLLATDDPAVSGESIWLAEQDEPLDVDISFVDAGVIDRCHVHRGCCTSVKARVRYHGQHLDEEFPPTTRLAAVYRWAAGADGFKLASEQIPSHGLMLPGTKDILDPETYLGSLVTSERCDVDLDLVPRKRYEG